MKSLLLIAALCLISCGGDVVVDDSAGADDDATGNGGSGSGSGNGTGDPGNNPCLSVPDVAGVVNPSSCTSDASGCGISCTDGDNHVWQVSCFEQACQCIYDNVTICLCSVTGSPGAICGGELPPCCPAPWINP